MITVGRVRAAYRTDTGQVRDHNEDFVKLREPQNAEDAARNGWLCIVADGVGGADAGEVASQTAAERTVHHYLQAEGNTAWGKRLKSAIMAAHNDLCDLIGDLEGPRRMGTTLVAAVLAEGSAFFANVGDSRGYRYRDGKIDQITKDHSLVEKLLDEGIITRDEAQKLNIGNIILQSIGSEQAPEIDLFPTPLRSGDILLLCSDGLTNLVADEEIAQIVGNHQPEEAADKLVRLANERGGHDNITVIVLQYGDTAD